MVLYSDKFVAEKYIGVSLCTELAANRSATAPS